MFTDLSVTALVGAVALLALAALMAWMARSAQGGTLLFGGRLAVRPREARGDASRTLAANQACAPYLQRYAGIVAGLAVLVVLLTFVSDVAAVVVHLLAVAFLALGVWVCLRKARAAVAA